MEIQIRAFQDKQKLYAHAAAELRRISADREDFISLLSNASALLHMLVKEINWVGFYLMKGGRLVLGPFQGKPAVTRIGMGEGVCGTAAATREVQLVENVHACENHIACDLHSRSEIVVPMLRNGELLGVLDMDSPVYSRFDEQDRAGLRAFVETLLSLCDGTDGRTDV